MDADERNQRDNRNCLKFWTSIQFSSAVSSESNSCFGHLPLSGCWLQFSCLCWLIWFWWMLLLRFSDIFNYFVVSGLVYHDQSCTLSWENFSLEPFTISVLSPHRLELFSTISSHLPKYTDFLLGLASFLNVFTILSRWKRFGTAPQPYLKV